MTLPAPEVRPDWTGPRITEWVKEKRAPKRPDPPPERLIAPRVDVEAPSRPFPWARSAALVKRLLRDLVDEIRHSVPIGHYPIHPAMTTAHAYLNPPGKKENAAP